MGLEELDHASSAPLSHELTYMLQSDSSIMTFGDENDPVKPKVHVAGSRSWYMYLQAPTMPISLDPFALVFSPIVKDMESLTRSMCASQISSLDSIFAFAA